MVQFASQSEIMGASFNKFRVVVSRLRFRTVGLLSRVVDWVVSLLLLLLLWPLWLAHYLLAKLKGHDWLVWREVMGRGARTFKLAEATQLPGGLLVRLFNSPIVAKSPHLWAVWRGDMSLVGPAPLEPGQARQLPTRFLRRLDARPGLVHSYFIKSRTNIAFASEAELAVEDTERADLKTQMGKAARAVPAALLGTAPEDKVEAPDTLDMFGLQMTNKTLPEALDQIIDHCRVGKHERIAFVNPDCINISIREADYREILERSDYIFPDGIGLQVACKLLRTQMKDNLNGTDLFPALCERIQGTEIGIYLFGAQPGVVDAMVENLNAAYTDLRICGYRHGFVEPENMPAVVEEINASGAHILLVAMGVPRQERWIDTHWPNLTVNLAMGVGGLFDFVSGRIPRAPIWMRELGLEWLFRLIQEPGRLWKRYVIGNFVFLWHVMRFGKHPEKLPHAKAKIDQ
ncbi:WecB/TagA/CpsF family glycosyltransferase [Sulfidibacter corallicola]|uniref:WecB/TagA/CpsF family glycosyltransferase n=1 Tax=Sulfidibacter corallicola TaxID=2818388 RepID=A0A8A4TG96_SULCO|nr:WecB/TagA/CpsF family glycosyltransferase [Sulfidibacter corallicola]QTD48547.1 WecB/TagA/CpsF family glycosyltransferase [Sulfidibacter corallicola]